MIRNYNYRNFHDVFFDHRSKPFPAEGPEAGPNQKPLLVRAQIRRRFPVKSTSGRTANLRL
jgi:hypothetical protein